MSGWTARGWTSMGELRELRARTFRGIETAATASGCVNFQLIDEDGSPAERFIKTGGAWACSVIQFPCSLCGAPMPADVDVCMACGGEVATEKIPCPAGCKMPPPADERDDDERDPRWIKPRCLDCNGFGEVDAPFADQRWRAQRSTP